MRITSFSVKNHQFTVIIFIMIMAIGISSLMKMPKAEDPAMRATFNNIIVVYPGTSPEDMEELVVDPIEEKLASLGEIKKIVSHAANGVASVVVEFDFKADEKEKNNEVLREVNALRNKLPQDIYSIDVVKVTPETVNIIQVGLLSESASYYELDQQAKALKDELKKIKGIKDIDIHAVPKRQVRIDLNTERMASFKIPLAQVMNLIQSENLNIPAGSIEVGERRINVKTSGSYSHLEEIGRTIVSTTGQNLTYLKDIADIYFDYEENHYLARLNGKRAIFLTASQKYGTNIFEIDSKISPIIEDFEKKLPANIQLEKSFDQAKSVSKRLKGLGRDFGIAILLVLITLIPLGIRASVIVMISIPLSLAIGLAGIDLLGYSINQLSVVGLIISLGLLVDDSIVVVENIARYLREGYSRKDAAIEGTKQISMAVLGCTATLILAFLPLTFLPEASGDFIRSLPMAVIMTVLASLFISLTIVPFLASILMPKEEKEEGNRVLQLMNRVIDGSYQKILHWSLLNPIKTLGIAILLFVGSILLIPVIGITVFPKSEKPQFLINIETPLGTSIAQTDSAVRYTESLLAESSLVKNYAANVGKDNPRIYYNIVPKGGTATNYGQIFVQLHEGTSVPVRTQFINELREKLNKYPGARIKALEFEQGAPVEAPLTTRIYGENLDTLKTLAEQVESLYKQTEGTIYVNNPISNRTTDLRVKINKEKAGLFGIPTFEIDRHIRMAISGFPIGNFRDENGENNELLLSLPRNGAVSADVFDRIFVPAGNGAQIPLSQLATLEFESSSNRIQHYNQARFTSVSSFVKEGYTTAETLQKFKSKIEELKFPKGYSYQLAGEEEQKAETFGGLGTIIIITIFGILAVLILEFKTFKSSFIVLSVIPLGVIGAVGILFLTGNTMSFTAVVGIIALAGIEVKNSILLVDYTNYLRKEEGLSIDEAIEKAGKTRFIPIVLTTLTAIGGLMPLVLEHSPLYSPLALVIIGGLISSLVLTRIVTPVMYKLLPPKIE
ncbi:acriflavin resistance protein [Leadbetterella byssophila DSM 17132]|uniref:Acriflavin resistance protein n=1 Tax=Leadbetterella byssophila (strain DSM 17132 / JCM 16389 / KACC 11308 / NBRC 106382 / 4M15) TaxID=649349 RepID=E4RQE1_LEAB4|nr:efflux RND transporter permease subunit [Leadbetterella byssophila]ADQ18349.1 acriflavin resistance protein [Leadbetterella byssophila DSM 17132]